jgi:hypothetical protein
VPNIKQENDDSDQEIEDLEEIALKRVSKLRRRVENEVAFNSVKKSNKPPLPKAGSSIVKEEPIKIDLSKRII